MEDNPFRSHLAVPEYYETAIRKFSQEKLHTYHQMAREGIPTIDLEYVRSGSVGLEYRRLVQETICRSSCDELLRIIAGYYSAFTPVERTAVRELLKAHDRRALDRAFWNADCARVLDDICKFLEGLSDPFEDRIKLATFELITNNLAVIAINVQEVREIASIRLFPWRNWERKCIESKEQFATEYLRREKISVSSLTRIPSLRHIVPCGFFDGADMSIQP